jgi:hypothetical protein
VTRLKLENSPSARARGAFYCSRFALSKRKHMLAQRRIHNQITIENVAWGAASASAQILALAWVGVAVAVGVDVTVVLM